MSEPINFWNKLMNSVEEAGNYMLSYGEGPDAETRQALDEYVTPEDSVLDVGCGPGWNMEHFEGKIRRYKGVDYASYFIQADNERRKQKQIPSDYALPFQVQDCRDLEEPDLSWDVVIIQDCLEHTNGYQRPVKEALRVARKRVVVAFWHLMWEKDEDNDINDDGDDGWGAWYSASKWQKYLDSLGYEWTHKQIIDHQGKPRDFYVIYKEQS